MLQTRSLLVSAAQVTALLGAVTLAALLAPGLGELRSLLSDADLRWLAGAVALQALSCASYVLMFRPVFCPGRSWRFANRLAWSTLAVGSLVPASGAAGLALGGWVLVQDGMEPERVARRSVAFFLVKGSVNFAAVALLGTATALGLFGPPLPLWLTAAPAALAVAAIAAVVVLARVGEATSGAATATPPGRPLGATATPSSRLLAATAVARRTIVGGAREAVAIVRSGDPRVIAGAVGYWIFDNAVLWATFHAFGAHVDPAIILLGYLIGQLGGLLPIPGGVGGIDGGLIGTLIVFGTPAAATAAAVLAYRVILFWLPLLVGAFALAALRRAPAAPAAPASPVAPLRYATPCAYRLHAMAGERERTCDAPSRSRTVAASR
jgi:uncharacterized membrane protein YbhN (UPF0104 family)